MKQCITGIVSLLLLAGCDISINTNAPNTSTSTVTLSDPGSAQQQRLVVDKALEFLLLLDAGRIDMTWPPSSSALKAIMSESVWVKTIGGLRMGLGEFKQRERAQISFTKQLPDAPPGHYAAVQIQSTFANMTVTELILLSEEDEQWRVAGYNISKSVEVAAQVRLF
ncbi:DUF4019 domain-containing protein [Pseudomonas aegrilactucae]|uniref:DUF4019 domain-containing protein n=1 Tax=Pseudomonas aegrilactucae TaxID=2854028 RepID=A0A9Q2XG36_9PSED|nr:DUF4019 domain-containing protein [Pseudomonas aegrilactucae]MBV6286086.1 DUF4019 domain-containing protein [Pseudomonas aegrilactucae]